jgi:hypothetical protein
MGYHGNHVSAEKHKGCGDYEQGLFHGIFLLVLKSRP